MSYKIFNNYYYKNFGLKKKFKEKESEIFVYNGKIMFCQANSGLRR